MKQRLILVMLLGGLGLLDLSATAVAQSVATTLAATSITPTNATLNGTVNPNGLATMAYFQYGLTTNYDNWGGFLALPSTNTTLALPGLVVNALLGPAGTTWTQSSAASANWSAIASSADGTHLAAVVAGGGIYTSTNHGGAWTLTSAPVTNWSSIASSWDGTRLAAVVASGGIYSSTNAGATWTFTSAPATNWSSIASSWDGTCLAAVVDGGGIYTSTNSGSAWTPTSAPGRNWHSIASSADGAHLAAVDSFDGRIWTSSDGGSTWTVTSAPNANYAQIASSADGSRLAATAAYTYEELPSEVIFTSTNAGVTWTQDGPPAEDWSGIASSADGSQLAAVASGGGICTSTGLTNSLIPATTCHYRAAGLNGAGTSLGNDASLTTLSAAPVDTTLPASDITTTNALANGTVNPNGAATKAWFQYGLTTGYGSDSVTNSLAATNTILSVSALFGNLTLNTTYHFRLVAGNSLGTSLGSDLTFTTKALTVTTLPATSVSTNATLNGTVSDDNAPAAACFQYGLTTNYDCLGGFVALPATNTTQTLPGLVVKALTGPAGATWTNTSAPALGWISLTSSADGTRLAAVDADDGGLYTSTNRGATWTLTSAPSGSNELWESIASSADGLRLAAVQYQSSFIYTSTNGGVTWRQNSVPRADYTSIASSADGLRLAAAASSAYNGGVFISTNAGATWTKSGAATDEEYSSIASSADGTQLAVTEEAPYALSVGIYVSTNAGVTWTKTENSYEYTSIAASADGMRFVAGSVEGEIAISTDGGASWGYALPDTQTWQAVAASADGMRLAVAANSVNSSGELFTSTDGGNTWTQAGAPAENWFALASSADGTQLVAGGYDDGIYISTGQAVNLAPGATCHYRAVGLNSTDTEAGGDLTFTIQGPPTVVTLAATNTSSTNATLYGTVNPNEVATLAYFQYGLTTNYGSYSATNVLAATNVTLAISNLISGLTPDILYHCRVVASNGFGTATGTDEVFGVVPHAFTGAEAGQGLDLQGKFVYAVNVGSNGAPGLIGNANFTADNAPGVSVTAVSNTLNTINNWASPDFGTTTNALRLAQTMSSIRWTATPGILTVNLTGIQVGRSYQLQMMFIEEADDREFAVEVNGTTIMPAFRLYDYGPMGTPIVIPYIFTAAATNVLIQLGGGTGVLDNNPTLSAFTLAALAPSVTTLAATSITATNAMLNGTVNPEGAATTAWFQYGLTTNYGNYSATNTLAATNTTLSVSNVITTLLPDTMYHFQLEAANNGGANAGADVTLTTALGAPVVTTLAASGITASNATLNGTVTAGGLTTLAWFKYGLTTNYGSVSATNTLVATNATLSVSNLISNLTPNTLYHSQLVGTNSAGKVFGEDMIFTTTSPQPVSFILSGAPGSAGGALQFSFTNLSGVDFTVLGTTNLELPLTNWTVLGPAVETPAGSGNYQFTGSPATNNAMQFYRVRSP